MMPEHEMLAQFVGRSKSDLIYQVEAIEEGRQFSTWPNERRRAAWFGLKADIFWTWDDNGVKHA